MRWFAPILVLAACGGDDAPAGASTADTATLTAPSTSGSTGTPPTSTGGSTTEAPDFEAAGPWSVGTLETTIDGPDGVELVVQVWYPSDAPAGSAVRYDGLWEGAATVGLDAACEVPRPVLVFSHGNAGIRWQSSFLTEHLASHGYVVIAPDHRYNTLFDLDLQKLDELAIRRPADVQASFDALAGIPEVASCVEPTDGYAVAGHSFGGYTALAVAGAEVNDPTNGGAPVVLGDPRAWATVGLAPWDGAGAITDGTRLIDIPTLILTGRQDGITPILQVRGLWGPLESEPRYLGILERGGHYTFSPAACLVETGDGCGPDDLPLDVAESLVRQSVAAFLESVRVDPSWIDGRAQASAELTWE